MSDQHDLDIGYIKVIRSMMEYTFINLGYRPFTEEVVNCIERRLFKLHELEDLLAKESAEVSREKKAYATEVYEQEAKRLYSEQSNNHPTIHSNRFTPWAEMSRAKREFWIDKVKEMISPLD